MMMRNVCLAFALVHADPRSLRGEDITAMEEVATAKAREEAAAKLTSTGPPLRKLASVASNDKKWPDGEVRYSLRDADEHRREILEALETIMNKVGRQCLKFIEVPDHDSNTTLKFQSGKHAEDGCKASIGYKKCDNVVNLGGGCIHQSTIKHEVLHALGVYHTQSRLDRDDHVNVYRDHIIEDAKHNFNQEDRSHNYGTEYDFDSIMHYLNNEYSVDPNLNTLETKDQSEMHRISNFDRPLSKLDIQLLQRMYACEACTEELTTNCQCGNAKSICNDGATCINGECQAPLDGSVNCEGGNLDGLCKSGVNNYNHCLVGDDVPCNTPNGTGFCSKGMCNALDCKGVPLGEICKESGGDHRNSCKNKNGGSCHASSGYGVCRFGRCQSRPCFGSNLGENCKKSYECGLAPNSCLGQEGAACDASNEKYGVCSGGKCDMIDCTGHENITGVCEQCEGKDETNCKTDNGNGSCKKGKCELFSGSGKENDVSGSGKENDERGEGETCFNHEMCAEEYYCSKSTEKGTYQTCQLRKKKNEYCQGVDRKCKKDLKCGSDFGFLQKSWCYLP